MSIAVENEKVFEHFGNLFPEIRRVVIDEMQPVDRCRFTRCAKWCQKEVQRSKNYIYGLSLNVHPCWFLQYRLIEICVMFDKHNNGFKFQCCIDQVLGKNYKKCVKIPGQDLWSIELDSSINLIQHCAEELKNLLQLYQNTIQHLYFNCSDNSLNNFDFEIKHLKNLKTLAIRCDMNLSQIFLKLRKPLEELLIDGRKNVENVTYFEEVYQVQNKITLIGIGLNYEQLTRLTAKHIVIDIGSLTEADIFNLIRSWQNATGWKKATRYEWNVGGFSHFNFPRFLDLLKIGGFDGLNRPVQKFPIKHFKDDQKVGEFEYYTNIFILKLQN